MAHRRHLWILLILAGLYLLAVNGHWAVKSDSALYLGLGRSLAAGEGMTFNGRQEYGIPPVVPFLVAGCRLLAADPYWLPNLCMTAMGIGVIVFAWLSVRRLASDLPASVRDTVTLGTLLVVGTSARLFIDSARILTDVPCLFFVTAGLYAFLRARSGHWAWYLVGSAVMVVAILTRLLAALFFAGYVVAAGVTAWQRGRKKMLLALVGGTVVAAGLFLLWALLLRTRTGPGAIDYLSVTILHRMNPLAAGKGAELLDALAKLPDALVSAIVYQKLSWFSLVPTALMAAGLGGAVRRRQWLVVWPTVFYVGFLVWWAPTAVASRYVLLAMPMLAYLLLVGVTTVARPIRKALARTARRQRQTGRRGPLRRAGAWMVRAEWRTARHAVSVAVVVAMAISLPKVAREVYWMRHPAFYTVYDGGRWIDYRAVADTLRRRADPSADRCQTPKAAVVHYWSGVRCDRQFHWKGERYLHVHTLPPAEFARAMADLGRRFVVVQTDGEAWSRNIAEAMVATGGFAPPERLGDLALFERSASSAPAPADGDAAAADSP